MPKLRRARMVSVGHDSARFEDVILDFTDHNERCNMTRNYGQITFIEMGIGPDERFERQARELANSSTSGSRAAMERRREILIRPTSRPKYRTSKVN